MVGNITHITCGISHNLYICHNINYGYPIENVVTLLYNYMQEMWQTLIFPRPLKQFILHLYHQIVCIICRTKWPIHG